MHEIYAWYLFKYTYIIAILWGKYCKVKNSNKDYN